MRKRTLDSTWPGVSAMGKTLAKRLREPSEVQVGELRLSEILNGTLAPRSGQADATTRKLPEGSDLSHTNLRGISLERADLSDLNLRGSDLRNANLNRANLTRCDLAGADLSGATLRGARLTETNLRDADLSEADLRDLASPPRKTVTGGLTLGGAVLTNSRLPEDLAYPSILRTAKEASRNCQITFLGMLAAVSYCVLTVLTTTDDKLIPNSAVSQLPVIQATVSIEAFYILAPAVLVLLYLYFQLSLDKLSQLLAELPSKFPDGSTLDNAVDPWFLNSTFVGGLVRLQYLSRRPLALTRVFVGYMTAWWSVPFVVTCLWLRYLRSHQWSGTSMQLVFLAVAIATASLTQWLWRRTLAGEPVGGPLLLAPFQAGRWKGATFYAILAVVAVILPVWVSYAAIEGDLASHPYFAADFSDKDVSSRPETWSDATDPELSKVRGADLQSRNLTYLKADDAFLAKSDFQEARLNHASFANANLRNARFQKAALAHSDFERADLRHADFRGADLSQAELKNCDLRGANLSNSSSAGIALTAANLQGAQLLGAHLRNATLASADLNGTNLRDADLTAANFRFADLQCADFAYAILHGANLTQVRNTRCADFKGAELDAADFSGADLSGAINLTAQQIEMTTTNEKSVLPGSPPTARECAVICKAE